ncbi:MAG: hypothetical protein H8D56_05700 [Planctomycetes bacterium]|nr:hypothetical protein [Planctomycetota bacterium]MBL7146057.1 hypothetical protein [Phycisphaerae bacterium]
MIFRFRSLIVPVCLFGCLFVVFGCKKRPGSEDVGIIPDNLATAALQIHAQYIKAVNSGEQERSDEISKKYWTDEIKRLNPVKVYVHGTNIVVVQKETANKQKGLYLILMISSYAPRNGEDGFTFTDLGNSVYKFERIIEN